MHGAWCKIMVLIGLLVYQPAMARLQAQTVSSAVPWDPVSVPSLDNQPIHIESASDDGEYASQVVLWQQPPVISVPGAGSPLASSVVPRRSRSGIRLASVPNMFGDTNEGGCGGLFISGALAASLEHPTYACSRLNVAENNSPIVRDRVYYSYRHFANASHVDAFSFSPQGREAVLDIERHTFAFEKTIGEASSFEMRVPVNTQLTSDLSFVQTDSGATTDGSNNNLDEVLNDRSTHFGNLEMILKRRFVETNTFYLSGGFGLNLPTAQSVRVRGNSNDSNYQIYDPRLTLEENINNGPINGTPPTGTALRLQFDGTYTNATFNLLPFVAFTWTPSDDWFAQGFGQIDVPLNESTGTLGLRLIADGTGVFDTLNNPDRARLAQQTLLRLNFGCGRWLYRSDEGYLNALAAVLEFHYSTTLTDSDIASLEILAPNQVGIPVLVRGIRAGFGNLENRIDVLNTVVGFPVYLADTSIYNGFAFPLSPGRGFDLEYILSINRRF